MTNPGRYLPQDAMNKLDSALNSVRELEEENANQQKVIQRLTRRVVELKGLLRGVCPADLSRAALVSSARHVDPHRPPRLRSNAMNSHVEQITKLAQELAADANGSYWKTRYELARRGVETADEMAALQQRNQKLTEQMADLMKANKRQDIRIRAAYELADAWNTNWAMKPLADQLRRTLDFG